MLKFLCAILLMFAISGILILYIFYKTPGTRVGNLSMEPSELKSFLAGVEEKGTPSYRGRDTKVYVSDQEHIQLKPVTALPDENGLIMVRTLDDETPFPVEAAALTLVYNNAGENVLTPWVYDSHYAIIHPDEFKKKWPLAFELLLQNDFYPDWQFYDNEIIPLKQKIFPNFLHSNSDIIVKKKISDFKNVLIGGIDYRGVYIYRPYYKNNGQFQREFLMRQDYHTLPPELEEIRLKLMLLNARQATDPEDTPSSPPTAPS